MEWLFAQSQSSPQSFLSSAIVWLGWGVLAIFLVILLLGWYKD